MSACTLPNPSLPRHGFRRRMTMGLAAGWVGVCGVLATAGRAAAEPVPLPPTPPAPQLNVGYLAEMPVSWRTGLADPLRNIARSLGAAFARPVDVEFPIAPNNLLGAESWDELSRMIQLGGTDLFPVQGYEFIEQGTKLNLKPLLLATRDTKWQTRFLLVASNTSPVKTLRHLENKTILIYRDGCGNLVDYWLDTAIAVGTGMTRKSFARYQTVTQPREAVLPVFFGEADACVISMAAYQEVLAQNPTQIRDRAGLVLAESKDLPSQVVACKKDLPVDVQRLVVEHGKKLTWDSGTGSGMGGMIAAEELAFDNLRALLEERAKTNGTLVPVTSPLMPSPRIQISAPVPPLTPAKRP